MYQYKQNHENPFYLYQKIRQQPCVFNFTKPLGPITPDPKRKFYIMVFDWENIEDEELHEDLQDDMGDELFENENLVPFAVYNPIDHIEIDQISTIEEYNRAMYDNRFGFLMYDKSTGKVFKSGIPNSPLVNSLTDLKMSIVKL